ncbi:MAG: class I SAM-dependent methyltransferase [Anaerolinea sp.]|nr:class I SAM-dependent methyltransferase [Anaerolinea sp.]
MRTPVEFSETADIETSSDDYAGRFAGNVGKWFLQVQERATLRMLAPYPGATVLDVGGGHGQIAGTLIQKNFDVTVVGSAPICAQRIQPYIDARRCTFDVVDFLELPYPDKSFGVVISYRLLPHVTAWKPFLAELCRVAEKAVIVDFPEVESINALAPHLFHLKKSLEGNTRTYTSFRRADLLKTFREQCFIYGEHYAEFFAPMVVHRKLQTPAISRVVEGMNRSLGLTQRWGSPVILKVIRSSVN